MADSSLSSSSDRVTVAYTNEPCRRKLQFINGKFAVQKPQTSTVQRRNERERNRVKLINRTFTTLRDRLPPMYRGKKERKLSKVEVLKTAADYIAYLMQLLREDDLKRAQMQHQHQPIVSCNRQVNCHSVQHQHQHQQFHAMSECSSTSNENEMEEEEDEEEEEEEEESPHMQHQFQHQDQDQELLFLPDFIDFSTPIKPTEAFFNQGVQLADPLTNW